MGRTRRQSAELRLTAPDVIAALTMLEPRLTAHAKQQGKPLLTARQLRYLDSRAIACVRPDRVGGSTRGRRVYRTTDVILLRLVLRVAAERSAWQAWSATAYLGDELREAIEQRRAVALVFEGARASIRPLGAAPSRDTNAYALLACALGVDAALRTVRERTADVWNGWQWVRPEHLAARAQRQDARAGSRT